MTCFSSFTRTKMSLERHLFAIITIFVFLLISQSRHSYCDGEFPEHSAWKNGELFYQLASVVVLEEPLLSFTMRVAVLHQKLLIITADGHATVR